MSDDERIRRAKQAELLLADPTLIVAQQVVIGEATRDMINSKYDELALREEAYMKMRGLTALLDVLGRFVQDGVNLTRKPKDGATTDPATDARK